MNLPTTTVDRWIDMPGAGNVRDIGGLVTHGGKTVKRGLVIRAEALLDLPPEGRAAFDALGIKTAVDLREDYELAVASTTWMSAAGVTIRHTPSPVKRKSLADVSEEAKAESRRAIQQRDQAALREFMASMSPDDMRSNKRKGYLTKPRETADGVRTLYAALAGDGAPALVHCAGGRDRTGVVIGVLLADLGVPMDAIVADYLLSNEADTVKTPASNAIMAAYGLEDAQPELLRAVSELFPAYINGAFEMIETEHGGLDAYLTGIVGVTAEQRDAVRARLLGA